MCFSRQVVKDGILMTLEQARRKQRREPFKYLGKDIPGRGNCKYKGHEVRTNSMREKQKGNQHRASWVERKWGSRLGQGDGRGLARVLDSILGTVRVQEGGLQGNGLYEVTSGVQGQSKIEPGFPEPHGLPPCHAVLCFAGPLSKLKDIWSLTHSQAFGLSSCCPRCPGRHNIFRTWTGDFRLSISCDLVWLLFSKAVHSLIRTSQKLWDARVWVSFWQMKKLKVRVEAMQRHSSPPWSWPWTVFCLPTLSILLDPHTAKT